MIEQLLVDWNLTGMQQLMQNLHGVQLEGFADSLFAYNSKQRFSNSQSACKAWISRNLYSRNTDWVYTRARPRDAEDGTPG